MRIYLNRHALLSSPPCREGTLIVDGLHSVYWSESGNPEGIPVHLIRGFGFRQEACVKCFDVRSYRVVQIDLRGTGRSSPPGEPWDNTLFAIIEDIERLRTTLEIEKWAVAASSWGTTFALAYGESCPDACLAFVLCGVLLGTESEKAWLFEAGARFFPRAHEEFIVWIDASERDNALRAYEMALFSSDRSLQLLAAKRWRRYIAICSRINPAAAGGDHGSSRDDEVTTIAHARVHVHYASHNMYLAEQQLLAEVGRIAHLPAVLIQGSADILCPPRAADKLRRVWPSASMYIVPGVTSDPSNPGISNAVLQASESFRQNGRFK